MIEDIRSKAAEDGFEVSLHTKLRSDERGISREEVKKAIASGEIIEDYPNDKYGPSCPILGYTEPGRVLHIQRTYPTREIIKIITVYEPMPSRWIDFRIRRVLE